MVRVHVERVLERSLTGSKSIEGGNGVFETIVIGETVKALLGKSPFTFGSRIR